MNLGYVKIHRSIMNWYGFGSPKRFHLWMTLLMLANHADNKFLFNGKSIVVKRGQLITGRKILSATTKMSESYVEDLLREFKREGQIQQLTTNTSRLITILNWDKYQGSNNASDNQSDNRMTTKRQRSDTNNNVNNENNVNKAADADFISHLKTNPAYRHIDFVQEFSKMDEWIMTHPGRKMTRRFVLNWLNKIEKPLDINQDNRPPRV